MSNKKVKFQEKEELAKFIIENTPIGFLNESLKHLEVLVKKETLNKDKVKQAIKDYHETHFIPIYINEIKSEVIFSPKNKDNDDIYYDNGKKIRFKVDLNLNPQNIETYESKNETRIIIEKKLVEYLNYYYCMEEKRFNPNYNVYYDSLLDIIHIIISVQNINPQNYYNGEWLSCWELNLKDKKMKGSIVINTIYFEEGKAQFNFNQNYNDIVKGEDNESIAKECIGIIEKYENEVQKKIDDVTDNFTERCISKLRRRESMTGKNMIWNYDQIHFIKIKNRDT